MRIARTIGLGLEKKKHEFATTVRRLNEKKLDLAEAEKQYQLEAR